MRRSLVLMLLVAMLYKHTDGRAMRNRVKHVACITGAKIRRGDIPRPTFSVDKADYRINGNDISCKAGHKLNVKNIRSMSFRCTKGIWNGYDKVGLEIEDFTLKNITCQEKVQCPRPRPPDNVRYDTLERYCLVVEDVSPCTNIFFTGDKISYYCKPGYQEIEKSSDDYYDDYAYAYGGAMGEDYGAEDNADEGSNFDFTCDEQGLWRNGQTDEIPICEKVICDASHFENISNGYIKNFTEIYEYGDILELVCDEGYNPINKRRLAQCLDSETFPTEEEFGCKQIKCRAPVPPIGGSVYYLNNSRNVGDMVMFSCDDFKSKQTGPKTLTCLESGEWNSDVCVLCIPSDADCPPPCMHEDTILVTGPETYTHGSVIELACRQDQETIYNRTCLMNNRWDNSDLHCKGKHDPLKAMSVADSLQKAMNSLQNHTIGDTDGLQEKTIDVGSAGGVDVYFALDVSGSIGIGEFEILKAFTMALTRNINISDRADGTRLAVYAFASHSTLLYNGHSTGLTDEPFNDTKAALGHLNDTLNLANIRDGTINGVHLKTKPGMGTNIKAVVSDVRIDVNTKRSNNPLQNPQQVLIIISDGQFTTDGAPLEEANKLKQKDVQIYSIYIGIADDKTKSTHGKEIMKAMASEIPDEKHYFEIIDNYEETIKQMVGSPPIPCGLGDPDRINISNSSEVQKMEPAFEHAWPWMVQIKSKGGHICGGSLIDKQHVLTAAHCFVGPNLDGPFEFILKSHDKNDERDHVVSELVEKKDIAIHEKFDKTVLPRLLYDIAVVTLPSAIEDYDYGMRAICLPNDENVFDSIRPNQTYGVVAGWGGERDELHQAQMMIPDKDTCIRNVPPKHKAQFNSTYMFCAGGEDDGETVDASKGDSGGPFVIEEMGKENTFIQIGIVSFSIGKEKKKKKNRYGFYTKLNTELVEWIHTKIKNEADRV